MLLNEVLIPILGPAFFAGFLWLAIWWPWRTPRAANEAPTAIQSLSLAAAFGVGLFLGYLKLAGWPPFPAKMATEWLAWMAIAWAILGYGIAYLQDKPVLRVALVFVLAAVTATLQSLLLMKYAWSGLESVLWIGLFGVLVVAAAEALHRAARHTPGAAVPVTLMICALGLFVSILMSYSAFLGQLAAILVAMAGAALVMSWISVRFSLQGPGVAVFYVLYLSLVGQGYFVSTLPALAAVCFAVAPFTAFLSAMPSRREPRSWANFFLNVFTSLAVAGLGTYVAYAQFAEKYQAAEY